MNVGDIIQRPPAKISAGRTLIEAARLMVEKNIGLLVISDPHDDTKIAGVISERDIIKAIGSGGDLKATVDSASTKRVITVKARSEVAEAAKAMNRNHIRHVVVVDDQDKLVGVVSMRDLVGERATLNAILQSNEKEIFVGAD
jgi:CBS domain-containing protein